VVGRSTESLGVRGLETVDHALTFIKARPEDVGLINALVNSAYRGDASRDGWTSEADLFDGPRTDENEIRGLIDSDDSMLLLCMQATELVGSVLLRKNGVCAYLGMLVIRPRLQGAGIGSRLMAAAELAARDAWNITRMSMTVIGCRHELIAFYERRGYRRTGQIESLPLGGLSVPRVSGLELEVLEKDLAE
jgi:GNAT superfamily N-acetyltransferase